MKLSNSSTNIPPHHFIQLSYVSVNVLLHGIACPLLFTSYKQHRTPQHLFLINLSLIELLINFLCVLMEVLRVTVDNRGVVTAFFAGTYITYGYLYYAAMYLITCDRLVATLLVLRYRIVCTINRAKITLAATWLFCIICGTTITTYNCSKYGMNWIIVDKELIDIYIYKVPVVLAVLYFVFVIICYLIMFCLYVKSKRSLAPSHMTLVQAFRGSKFFVSLLLILSFLFLMVIPFIVLANTWKVLSPTATLFLEILTYSSDTVDFLIYVFIYRPVTSIMRRSIKSFQAKRSVGGKRKELSMELTTATKF